MHVACIRTYLISGASAVSLVPRPEDRLLSSSLGSFSGPPSTPSIFCTGMLGGGLEQGYISLARPPQQLLEQHALLSLMSLAYSACTVFVLLFQQRAGSAVTFDSTFLFEASPLFAWVTSRTRLCHIDDRPPKLHFENSNIDYIYGTTYEYIYTYIHTYRHRLRSTR